MSRLILSAGLSLGMTMPLVAAEPTYIDPQAGTSKAVVVAEGALAHTSQQYPLADGKVVGKSDAATQVEKVLDNLDLALKEAKSDLNNAVKINVYTTQGEVLQLVQQALAKRLNGKSGPAVCSVVGKLAHPDALVCMDAVATTNLETEGGKVAHITSAALARETGSAHVSILPAGPVVYISGQAERGKDMREATRKTIAGLRKTLQFLGLDDSNIVQVKSFLKPMDSVDDVRAEMAEAFGKNVPSQVYVEWTYPLIEIEMIASAPKAKEKSAIAIDYLTPPGITPSPNYAKIARIHFGPRIYVAGLTGAGDDGAAQIKDIFSQLDGILKKAGGDFEHMAKATYYVSTEDASKQLNVLRPNYYNPKRPPAASKAGVTSVGVAGKGIVFDMIAVKKP